MFIDLRSLRLCLIQSIMPSTEKKTNATIVAIGITKIEMVMTVFGRGNEGKLRARVHCRIACQSLGPQETAAIAGGPVT